MFIVTEYAALTVNEYKFIYEGLDGVLWLVNNGPFHNE